MKLPKQTTMTYYLHVRPGDDGQPIFALFSVDATKTIGEYACLGPVELSVDVPQVDPVAKMISSLERQIEAERADSQQRINILLDRLSKLQCLEHKPEGEA